MSFHDCLLSSTILETKAEGDPPDVATAVADLQRTFEEKITGLRDDVDFLKLVARETEARTND